MEKEFIFVKDSDRDCVQLHYNLKCKNKFKKNEYVIIKQNI